MWLIVASRSSIGRPSLPPFYHCLRWQVPRGNWWVVAQRAPYFLRRSYKRPRLHELTAALLSTRREDENITRLINLRPWLSFSKWTERELKNDTIDGKNTEQQLKQNWKTWGGWKMYISTLATEMKKAKEVSFYFSATLFLYGVEIQLA